jgi:class 3 adenylate cyclase
MLAKPSRDQRVLVVDDDWLNRELLEAYIADAGYGCETAADGEEAVDKALASSPDLILLDVQMPRLDGYEVCRRLKADPLTQFVPIVIVTARDAEEEKIKAIEAGADDFITKPFNSLMLLTRVRSLMRIKRLHDALEARNTLLRQVLTRYVDDQIADVILTDPERHLKLGGQTRPVTVLFADIRGFTEYTERHTAEQVVEALNLIFTDLTRLVAQHHGTFDKYLGDEIMAFYGAPVSEPDDAKRAVTTAIEMRDTFAALCQASGERFAGLGLGIGLHTGEATVGNVGSERVMDYTVIGDTVNVAHRLQEAARSGEILISEATFRLVEAAVRVRRVDTRRLSGRSQAVVVYSLTGLAE